MEKYRLALITGAAHRLGKSFALCLAKQGYAILLHYNESKKAAEETADEIRSLQVPVYVKQSDLTRRSDMMDLFKTMDSKLMPLGILVNSAAVMVKGSVKDISVEEWNSTLAINLTVPFLMGQFAAARMPDGLIVNISDAGAHKLWTSFPAYIVSKSALETLTKLQAKAFAPKIRVNAIAPGLTLRSPQVNDEEWKTLVSRVPIGRSISADEITKALIFLINNEMITGQTIVVDGGFSLVQ